MNGWVLFRVCLGALFLFSGFEKLLQPYQNFLLVIESYDVIHGTAAELAARAIPWIELVSGTFLLVGLWLVWALRAVWLLCSMFLVVVAQAMWRQLPVDECGCFGGLITLPLPAVLGLDACLWVITFLLIRHRDQVSQWSLDRRYA